MRFQHQVVTVPLIKGNSSSTLATEASAEFKGFQPSFSSGLSTGWMIKLYCIFYLSDFCEKQESMCFAVVFEVQKKAKNPLKCEVELNFFVNMPGYTGIVCSNNINQDAGASFHNFSSEKTRRQRWLEAFKLDEYQLRPQSQVCLRHFPNGDCKKDQRSRDCRNG